MADLVVNVDMETCSGCGVCEGAAGEVFQMNGDGCAEVNAEGLAAADREVVVEAAQGCPCEAITVIENGEKIVPA